MTRVSAKERLPDDHALGHNARLDVWQHPTTQQKLLRNSKGQGARTDWPRKKHLPDSLPIVLGSPIFESKSCFHDRRPIAESQELQWRSISSCSFPYLREKASKKSKYIAQSEINTYRTSCNRAMTLSFSLRITIWQVVQTAFSFFLVRHLYTRASQPQHLSSAIFAACARTVSWNRVGLARPIKLIGRARPHVTWLRFSSWKLLLLWSFSEQALSLSFPPSLSPSLSLSLSLSQEILLDTATGE